MKLSELTIVLYVGDIERESYAIPRFLLEFLEEIIPPQGRFVSAVRAEMEQDNIIITEVLLNKILRRIKKLEEI